MRITNKMMTNNMMSNINKNKLNVNSLEQQYSTGKKIQRPSDDPIITVRALKLRTNLSELEQYYEKNIPDAKSWMDVTESALRTINDVLKQINTYCVQGSSDTLTAADRSSIVQNLVQMKEQIYHEGNTNYAGRYVFTGYKTDTSLTFTEDTPNLTYKITEESAGNQIQIINKITGSYKLEDLDDATEDFSEPPKFIEAYRIQLSYDKLSQTAPESIKHYKKNEAGDLIEQEAIDDIVSISANHPDAYNPDPDEVHYLYETGELILGKNIYDTLRVADKLETSYIKTGFSKGDIRPEHYFDCEMTDSYKPEQDPIIFEKAEQGQPIQYEINYNQKLTINTEASDAISHTIGRRIDDILNAVDDVIETETKIKELDKLLSDTSLSPEKRQKCEAMKQQAETELELKKEAMQKAFAKGITVSTEEQDRVNMAVADLGSRYVRLELTENRLSSQKVDFEELLSKNEDVDVVEAYIKLTSAEAIYNAALSAASKVVQNSLLDFL